MQVPLKLLIIKPIHVGWLVEFYNYLTLAEGKKYICSGWKTSVILDAVQMGKANFPSISPFNDLDSLLPSTQKTQESDSVIALPQEQNGLRCSSDDEYDELSDGDSE